MKLFSRLIISLFLGLGVFSMAFADDFVIIPEGGDNGAAVDSVGEKGGKVWETYNAKASGMTVGDQMASGIMTWDTILNYIVYLIKFLSQLALVIGAAMIIYAGYLYAMSVFSGQSASKGKTAVTNAITGILIVIFSFAIMRIITSMFL